MNRFSALVATALLWGVLADSPARCASDRPNLLRNGDFVQRAKRCPPGWRRAGNRYSEKEGATMEVSYDDGVPYAEGLPVIKVTKFAPPSGKGAYRFDTEPFPVEPGKSYRFSIWLRADAPISVAFTFDGGSSKLHRLLGKDYRHWWHRPKRQAALDEQWREYALVTRVPGPGDAYYIAGMREVRITISSANGTYWAANAKVVELGNSAADASKPPEGEGQTPGMEYTYVPKDKVGDLTVFLDDLRLLRASWKGINLFHKWGELYSPISWGFRKGRSHKGRTVYQPDDLDDVIWVYLVNDVPVRVQRSKRRVEYLWGTSYCLSEFSANDVRSRTIPAVGACSHLQSDVRQLNRLVMTGNRITVTTTLKFLDRPKNKVIFYPVIFPGTGRNRKYLPELRVLAQPCNVIDRHGRTYTQILPRERKAAVWLDSEPRSLLWDLEGVGRIRYDFRFSDPSVSLLFYAHTGWPTPSLNPYVCPAIVGKIAIPAQDGLKDGAYACTMQMAVTVGDAAEHGPERDGPPKPLPLDDHFDLRVAAPRPSYRFLADDAIELTVVVDGFRTGRPRDLTLDARVLDYENQQAHRQQLGLSLPRDIDQPLKLRLPSLGTGAFVLDVQLLEGDRVVGAKAQRFCVVDKPVPHPAAKSFFGCANGFVRFPGADLNDIRETLSLAVDLGIKKLRWNENYTVDWKKAEPTPGNYVFPTEFPKLEIARSLGMSNFLSFASFEGARATPEWAKSGRKTLYSYDVPKDLQAYEDYCYQVAARFKGLIREFELENEPNYVRPENDREMQDYLADKAQILAAAYRGIKRAQPGAIVIGGTIGVTGLKSLKWLDRLLEHAQRKGWRLYDVMAPHYILRSGPPEECLENLKYARQIADRYGLALWNGENGNAQDPFHNIYPNFRFLDLEKDYANTTVRQYLLHKAYGVEHVNICHAVEWVPPRGVFFFEYEAPIAGKLYGMGGFVKPWAVAHAALAARLEGSRFVQWIDLGVRDSWCAVFRRGDETTAAIWMREDTGTLHADLPAGVLRVSIVGRKSQLAGRTRLAVGQEPFYLTAQRDAGPRLVDAIAQARLTPSKVIELGTIRFSRDKKAFEVDVLNYSAGPSKIDAITLAYGTQQLVLAGRQIPGGKRTTLRFVPHDATTKSVVARVAATAYGKTYTREQFVLYPSYESVRAMGYLIAVRARTPVRIDGDLSEWAEAEPIALNERSQVIYNQLRAEDLGGWKGPDDLSAVAYLMWDDERLYFAAKVTDDAYANAFPDGKSSTWNCDSIQLAFDPLMDNKATDRYYNADDQEINLALNQRGPAYWRRTFSTQYRDGLAILPDGQMAGAELAVTKWAKGLIYEFAVPFKELRPLRAEAEALARFNFIVNDDDGGGRRMWMGVTPGIGERKAPFLYKKLYLVGIR